MHVGRAGGRWHRLGPFSDLICYQRLSLPIRNRRACNLRGLDRQKISCLVCLQESEGAGGGGDALGGEGHKNAPWDIRV